MQVDWNTPLVLLSVLIAMIGSFTALSHAERMRANSGRTARVWMIAGGITLGLAIWAMHFIGMAAFHLSIPIGYDLTLTLLSVLPAIAAAMLGFYVLREAAVSTWRIAISSLLMGAGISVMHYTGMAAIKMSPPISYDPMQVTASILIAILASVGALLMMYQGDRIKIPRLPRLVLGGAIMGLAVSGMHYTAMFGMQIFPGSVCLTYESGIGRDIPALVVSLVLLLWFGGGMLAVLFDQRMARQNTQALVQLEQAHLDLQARAKDVAAGNVRIQTIIDTVFDGIITINEYGTVESFSLAAERIFGYAAAEVTGRNVNMLMPEPYHTAHDGYLEHYRTTSKARITSLGREIVSRREVAGRRKDGSTFPMEVAVTEAEVSGQRLLTGVLRDISERKVAEAEVNRLSLRLDLALASAQLGIWDWDVERNVLLWDDRMYALYGVAREAFFGAYEAWLVGVHPNDRARCDQAVQAALRGEKPYDIEFRVCWPDGTIHWIKANGQVLRGAAGQALRAVGINFDITKRKEAEIALLEKEHLLSQSQRIAHIGGWSWDMKGPIHWTDETYRVYGRSPETFTPTAESLVNLVHLEDRSAMQTWLTACAAGKNPGELEFRTILPDGTVRFLSGHGELKYDAENRPIQMTGTVQDITVRKQAEIQRSRSVKDLADFKAALDQHAILATTDARGTITYANDKFCAVSKYAQHELIGQNHRILNSGLHPKTFFRDLWQTIGSGNIWRGEIRNRAKDGTFYWVNSTIVPFLDEHGKPVQYIAIRADITQRKQAEQALIAARTEAERANRAKDSFLATMSHEIRTPLGGLMGMLELLSLSQLRPEQIETLETARDSGRSLLRILNDILDWSKIEEGKLELAPQVTSIAGLVAEVANTYSHVASSNSVTLEQQVDERLSPAHIVDPLRLSQVLNNFVSNAIKFSRGGRVKVRAELLERRDSAEQVRFSVKDTGIGIDPAVQEQLFQNYSQASPDTARMYGGTGLGLAICQRLADLLDGRIELDSAPGQGSTFSITLTLPISDSVGQARQRPVGIVNLAAVQPFDHGVVAADGPLILVVDDNPINRQLLARQLGLFGLRAETTEDGKAALSLYRAGRFALIITDCHMPKMDGYELTRAIRAIEAAEACPRTPIFAWTANALAEEIENCQTAGMDELLVKPTELAHLKQTLAKWLPTGVSAGAETQTPAAVSPAASLGMPLRTTLARLDVSVLAALVGDDPPVIREFLQNFRTSLASIAAEIRAASIVKQATAVGAAAHKLKSSARSVGALRLGELCADLEAASKTADDGAVKALLPRFEAEMAAVDEALAASTAGSETPQGRETTMTGAFDKSALSIMLLDDDPFMLNLLRQLLENLGFTALSPHSNGYQALDVLDGVTGPPDLILLDLNMPEMDGIEFIHHLVERRYVGSIVLLSGEDERTLQAASTLALAHQIKVLGNMQKPVTQSALEAVLAKWTPPAPERAPTAKANYDADAVRAAIANGELINYYQPTVAVGDGRVVGVETLVRWRHPVDGLVFPDQFIGVAEAHGLIDDLVRVVLHAALAQTHAWQDAGLGLRVAVNVSMDNLTALSFADFVASAAAEAGMAPSSVVLEVTESRLMEDLRAPLEILTRLRLKRFRLSIDDFGTGHSSLAQLRDIPFDELKIDRSFVHGVHADPTLRAIFEGNLNLARKLGIEVVAEGVEDREDWDFLRRAGCDLAQGYFIARPMPAADFPEWIESWEARLREQSLTIL